MKFIKGNAVALVALFFALTGTGIAASHYLITSTSQIKPSVISQLRNQPLAEAAGGAKIATKGGKILRALVHSTGVGAASTVERVRAKTASRRRVAHAASRGWGRELILADSTWTQYPEEITEGAADVITTFTQEPNCGQFVDYRFYLENEKAEIVEEGEGGGGAGPESSAESSGTVTWENGGGNFWQFPRATDQLWKISVEVRDRQEQEEEGLGRGEPCKTSPPEPHYNVNVYIIGAQ